MLVSRTMLAALALPFAVAGEAHAQSAPSLGDIITPHRAVYDIHLVRTEDGSGVSSANGLMVFEVTGGACNGYYMRQRMVVSIGDEAGNLGKLDFQIETFESGSGDLYSFDSRTTMNEQVVEAVEGEARRLGSDIEVTLKQPAAKTVHVSGKALFPSQHLQAIMQAARGDRRFLSVDIYEGAGSGETSDAAAAAIGRASHTSEDSGPIESGTRQWPVSIAYFEPKGVAEGHAGEELPSYQMSFVLYENGVTSDLVMDYGDYALSGSLQEVKQLDGPDCASP